MSDGDSEGDLLGRCPFCDYSLQGLPTLHHCPECGAACDRRWRVFGLSTDPARRRRRRRITLGVLGGLSAYFLPYISVPAIRGDLSTAIGAGVLYAFCLLIGLFLLTAERRFAAFGPTGLLIFRHGHKKTWTWAELGPARFEIASNVYVATRFGEIRLGPSTFFGGAEEADRFIRNYNAFRASDPNTHPCRAENGSLRDLIETVAGVFANRLSRCPFCENDLSAVPTQPIERCRGCGLDLDRRWVAFGGPRHAPRAPAVGAPQFIITVLCVAAVTTLGIAFSIRHPTLMTSTALLLLAGIMVGAPLMNYQPVCRAFVGPGGVTFFQKRIRKVHVPWSSVRSARLTSAGFNVRIELTNDEVLDFSRFTYFGWRRSEGRQFLTAVCAGADEHRAAAEQIPSEASHSDRATP